MLRCSAELPRSETSESETYYYCINILLLLYYLPSVWMSLAILLYPNCLIFIQVDLLFRMFSDPTQFTDIWKWYRQRECIRDILYLQLCAFRIHICKNLLLKLFFNIYYSWSWNIYLLSLKTEANNNINLLKAYKVISILHHNALVQLFLYSWIAWIIFYVKIL